MHLHGHLICISLRTALWSRCYCSSGLQTEDTEAYNVPDVPGAVQREEASVTQLTAFPIPAYTCTVTLLQRSGLGVERITLLLSKGIMLGAVHEGNEALLRAGRVCSQNSLLLTIFGSGLWGSRVEITLVPWLIWNFKWLTWLTEASAVSQRGLHFAGHKLVEKKYVRLFLLQCLVLLGYNSLGSPYAISTTRLPVPESYFLIKI